ncbi:hypothetical protein [Paracoccus isoporae]|nr:hypothetical protein [Paracoccus isoporae]
MLRIHLDAGLLEQARSGSFNFINRIVSAVERRGWKAELAPETDAPPERYVYALHHMSGPTHKRVKIFRRTYVYPYWHIESEPQRWRWQVARRKFRPAAIDQKEARVLIHHLRHRVMPDITPTEPTHVLIPLQRQLTQRRSFQTMSPIEMVSAVAKTGKPCIATLHPNGEYTPEETEALDLLASIYPNLKIGGNSRDLLAGAEYVATQNSAVAFEAYLLARPVVLFAQIDFHHIALNVSELGVEEALSRAPDHKAYYAKYLWWFLKDQAIDAMAETAEERILAAMKKGGWPL